METTWTSSPRTRGTWRRFYSLCCVGNWDEKLQEESNREHGLSQRMSSLGYTMSYFFSWGYWALSGLISRKQVRSPVTAGSLRRARGSFYVGNTNRLQTWHNGWVVVLWPALMFGSQVPFFWKIQNNIKQNKNAPWLKIDKIHSMNRSLESNANRIILSILLFQYFIVVFSVQYCVSVFNCRGILLFFSF